MRCSSDVWLAGALVAAGVAGRGPAGSGPSPSEVFISPLRGGVHAHLFPLDAAGHRASNPLQNELASPHVLREGASHVSAVRAPPGEVRCVGPCKRFV